MLEIACIFVIVLASIKIAKEMQISARLRKRINARRLRKERRKIYEGATAEEEQILRFLNDDNPHYDS